MGVQRFGTHCVEQEVFNPGHFELCCDVRGRLLESDSLFLWHRGRFNE